MLTFAAQIAIQNVKTILFAIRLFCLKLFVLYVIMFLYTYSIIVNFERLQGMNVYKPET